MLNDINEDLGGGSPSFKFAAIGDTVKGKVIGGEKRQDTDLQGTPKTWDDGSPVWVYVLELQTDLRNFEGLSDNARDRLTTDDGVRAVWARGRMWKAIKTVVQAKSGGKGLEPDGTLAVQYTADEATKFGGPAKCYAADYAPPAPKAMASLIAETAAPAPAAPASLI